MKGNYLKSCLFVILLLAFALSLSTSKGIRPSSAFGVHVGDQATYYVKEYFVNATDLPPEYAGTGELFVINQFTVAGSNNITAGTNDARFNISIVEISEGLPQTSPAVTYEVSNGNNALNVSESGLGFGSLMNIKSLLFAQGLNASTFGLALSDSYDLAGTPIFPGSTTVLPSLALILPLTTTDPATNTVHDTWTALSHFYGQTYVDETYHPVFGDGLTLIFSSETSGDDIELSGQVNGTLTNQTTGDHLAINHTLNYVFETTTGTLKYLKDFLDVEGTITGNTTVAKQKIEIERESFTPASSPSSEPPSSASPSDTNTESSTGDDSIPGFGFAILLVSFSFIGVIVLSRKRKR
ncbi:MAG: hypothetical protein ACXADX_19255 [Candidatus Hodarchaeales archaeon]|jgi:hypothetical protein